MISSACSAGLALPRPSAKSASPSRCSALRQQCPGRDRERRREQRPGGRGRASSTIPAHAAADAQADDRRPVHRCGDRRPGPAHPAVPAAGWRSGASPTAVVQPRAWHLSLGSAACWRRFSPWQCGRTCSCRRPCRRTATLTTPRRGAWCCPVPRTCDRVDEVRAGCDAIMVGAGTIRSDNPRLLVRSGQRRERRAAAGLPPSPAKVTITASGELDPSGRFFADDGTQKLVYAPEPAADPPAARTRPPGSHHPDHNGNEPGGGARGSAGPAASSGS